MRQGGNRDTSKLLMERSVPGRAGAVLPESDVPPQPLPDAALLRDDLPCPSFPSRRWCSISLASASATSP